MVKEWLELHYLRIYRAMIRLDRKYLQGARFGRLKCPVFGGKTGSIATVKIFLWSNLLQTFRSGPNPYAESF
jgi:hypothetical protein